MNQTSSPEQSAPPSPIRVHPCSSVSLIKIRDIAENLAIGTAALTIRIKEHAAIWREALAADRARPKLSPMNRAELAFLPAALEVAETPANPAARIIAIVLAAAFLFTIVWA